MNESRWGLIANNTVGGRQDTGATFEESSAYLKNWINTRLDWLNNGENNLTPLAEGAKHSSVETLDSFTIADLGASFTASINNIASSKNLAIADKNVVAWDSGDDDQKWNFVRQDDGSYKLENKGNPGYYLTVFESLKYGEMNVLISPDNNSDGQKWYILNDGNGKYILRAKCSNAAIDVNGGSTAINGTNVSTYMYNATDAQKFTLNVI